MVSVNNQGLLAGKVAVVTGASRGIGESIALRYAQEGAKVVVSARTVEEGQHILPGSINGVVSRINDAGGEAIAVRYAQEGAKVVVSARTVEEGQHILPGSINGVVSRINDAGGEAIAVRCDLSVEDDRVQLIQKTEDAFGPVDILVNNGAVTYFIPVEEFPEKRFKLMLEVQVYAPFHLSQLVLPGMRARRSGWILNISSHAALHPKLDAGGRGGTVYGMCKAALERFTTGLASEVYADNIGVNVISPGLIATPGAVFFKLVNETNEHLVVPPENMAEACLRLVHGDPKQLSGRITYAADMIEEFGLKPAALI